MGLINFIKNQLYSYEEELVEKEIEEEIKIKEDIEINPPTKLPTILREELFSESIKNEPIDNEIYSNKTKFTFPLTDDEIMVPKQEEVKKPIYQEVDEHNIPINTLVGHNYYETEKKFKPSQVISPVYGILDKNYRQEDITIKDERLYAVPRKKNLTYEDIRKKAYGTLTDEIELNLYEDNEEIKKTISNIDELLDNMNKRYDQINSVNLDKPSLENTLEEEILASTQVVDGNKQDEKESIFTSQNEDYNNYLEKTITEELNSYKQQTHDLTSNKDYYNLTEEIVSQFNNEELNFEDGLEKEISDGFNNEIDNVKIIDHNSNNISNIGNDNNEEKEEDLFNLIDSMYEKGEQ